MQGVSAWNFDVAALKEQAQKEGGLDPALDPILEGTISEMNAQAATNGIAGAPCAWICLAFDIQYFMTWVVQHAAPVSCAGSMVDLTTYPPGADGSRAGCRSTHMCRLHGALMWCCDLSMLPAKSDDECQSKS